MATIFFTTKPRLNIFGVILACILLAFIITIFFVDGGTQSLPAFLEGSLWGFVICFTQWIGHSYIYSRLDKRYSWQENAIKRAIINSIAIIVYAVIAYLVVSLIMVRLVYGSFPENPISWALKSSSTAILVSFAVCIIIVTIGFFKKWKSSLLEAERLKSEMLRYKYESLQNQINPHFLFNSFNVLSDLVFENQQKAVQFIKQMSQLFRYVLDSRDKELVPISEEMDFIASFAFLLQTRFEDKLTLDFDVKSEKHELMVPMTLQLLIENCVKHNEISTSKPLKISVSRINGYIEVVNNLQSINVGKDSKATGLPNIIQQYSYFTDKPIEIEKTEQYYAVRVPVIKASDK